MTHDEARSSIACTLLSLFIMFHLGMLLRFMCNTLVFCAALMDHHLRSDVFDSSSIVVCCACALYLGGVFLAHTIAVLDAYCVA